jgi:signal transduction histidine kinase
MTRLLPTSLFWQTLLLLLLGLAVSHGIGAWIYSQDRESAVRAVGGLATAQRIANLSQLVDDMPQEWRTRLVDGLSDATLQVALSDKPMFAQRDDSGPVADVIRAYLAQQLRLPRGREPIVSVDESALPRFGPGPGPRRGVEGHPERGRWHDDMQDRRPEWRGGDWRERRGHGPGMHGRTFSRSLDLQVSVPLSNEQWLSFATDLPSTGQGFSNQYLISLAIMTLFIVAISAFAVRRITAPLSTIAAAAEHLGRDVNAPPLPESGSAEMRQAAQAFNAMQTQLRALIDNRTRMLAALSHDLRTPLTLLRLRAENVEDRHERDKMLATIAEMDAMIGATLQFASDQARAEPLRPADLTALVQSIVDDMADAGLDVTMTRADPVQIDCQPVALKRALTNLIDNAVKYGVRARLSLIATPQQVEITVDDDGPGIPEDQLQRVFEPFYRVEQSRSRETGGVGLGLAIAQAVVAAQNGTLTLSNRVPNGLNAKIVLPRTCQTR